MQQANGKRYWVLLGSALHGPRYLFVLFSVACLALHGPRHLFVLFSAAYFACKALVIFSLSFRTSWGPLGSLFAALGALLAALGPLRLSWGPFGCSWVPFGCPWGAHGRLLEPLGHLLGRPGGHQNGSRSKEERRSIDLGGGSGSEC